VGGQCQAPAVHTGEGDPFPYLRDAGYSTPLGRVWGKETLLPTPGFGLRTVQAVSSRCFDYTVGLESRTVYVLFVKHMKYLIAWSRSCLEKVEIDQATVDSFTVFTRLAFSAEP